MRYLVSILIILSLFSFITANISYAEDIETLPTPTLAVGNGNETIPDPFEPVNRAFFHVNDKLYFWILKPAAKGYSKVVPEPVRRSLDNFLYNLMTPIRMINELLQLKFKKFVKEFARCLANTTVGVGGLFDPAGKWFNLPRQDEDFGQTLGVWGVKEIFYIDWPVLGPSCARDTTGTIVDAFMDPLFYLLNQWTYIGVKAFYEFNQLSFKIGEYEEIKEDAFDPYISLRNIYFQYRRHLIKE